MWSKYKFLKYKRKLSKLGGIIIDLNNVIIINNSVGIKFTVSTENNKNKTYFQVIQNGKRYLVEKKNINCIYDVPNNNIYIYDNNDKLISDESEIIKIKNILATNNNVSNFIVLKKKLIEHDISLIKIFDSEGCYNANLVCIKDRLHELNQVLQINCPKLHLEMDDFYKMDGIEINNYNNEDYILCLYMNEKCISKIKLKYIGTDMLEISSSTDEKYEGKKYNKLLRIVSVIIAPKLNCNGNLITALKSDAINPISAWLLISNFDVNYTVNPPELWELMENKDTNFKDAVFKVYDVAEKMNEELSFEIIVKLSSNNIRTANKLFLDITNNINGSIIC